AVAVHARRATTVRIRFIVSLEGYFNTGKQGPPGRRLIIPTSERIHHYRCAIQAIEDVAHRQEGSSSRGADRETLVPYRDIQDGISVVDVDVGVIDEMLADSLSLDSTPASPPAQLDGPDGAMFGHTGEQVALQGIGGEGKSGGRIGAFQKDRSEGPPCRGYLEAYVSIATCIPEVLPTLAAFHGNQPSSDIHVVPRHIHEETRRDSPARAKLEAYGNLRLELWIESTRHVGPIDQLRGRGRFESRPEVREVEHQVAPIGQAHRRTPCEEGSTPGLIIVGELPVLQLE